MGSVRPVSSSAQRLLTAVREHTVNTEDLLRALDEITKEVDPLTGDVVADAMHIMRFEETSDDGQEGRSGTEKRPEGSRRPSEAIGTRRCQDGEDPGA